MAKNGKFATISHPPKKLKKFMGVTDIKTNQDPKLRGKSSTKVFLGHPSDEEMVRKL